MPENNTMKPGPNHCHIPSSLVTGPMLYNCEHELYALARKALQGNTIPHKNFVYVVMLAVTQHRTNQFYIPRSHQLSLWHEASGLILDKVYVNPRSYFVKQNHVPETESSRQSMLKSSTLGI